MRVSHYNGEEKSWSEVFSWVSAGSTVTLYLNSAGGADYIFVGGGSEANSAVIVYENGSTAGVADLTALGLHGSGHLVPLRQKEGQLVAGPELGDALPGRCQHRDSGSWRTM